ncbi:hypothetical protein H4R34_005127, partial [Dimargaris verticillata]
MDPLAEFGAAGDGDGRSDDEVFEIVDYTTASAWEKCVASIEDLVRCWGLAQGQVGGFSDQALTNHQTPSSCAATPPLDGPKSGPLLKDAVIQLDDSRTFCLTYSCHPTAHAVASHMDQGHRRVFLPLAPPTDVQAPASSHSLAPRFHPLHRWTGEQRLLVLTLANTSSHSDTPSVNPALFGVTHSATHFYAISPGTAKLLLSSLAIALQNTGCSLPVFVPVGDWALDPFQYLGYRLARAACPSPPASPTLPAHWLREAEFRYNTLTLYRPPSVYTTVEGLLQLFVSAVDWPVFLARIRSDESSIVGSPRQPGGAPMPRSPSSSARDTLWPNIDMAVLYQYEFRNQYDRHWKDVDYDNSTSYCSSSSPFTQSPLPTTNLNQGLLQRSSNPRARLTRRDTASSWFSASPSGGSFDAESPPSIPLDPLSNDLVSALSFGPVNDPLRTLRLQIYFPLASSDHYLAQDDSIMLDAAQARTWTLGCQFTDPQKETLLLCDHLEESIAFWVQNADAYVYALATSPDPTLPQLPRDSTVADPLVAVQAVPKHPQASDGGWTVELSEGCLEALQKTLERLFDAEPVETLERPTLLSDHDSTLSGSIRPTSKAVSVPAVIAKIRHGVTVPKASFLWRLCHYLFNVVSLYSSSLQPLYLTNLLRVLWPHVVRVLQWHWDNAVVIPHVNTAELLAAHQAYQDRLNSVRTNTTASEATNIASATWSVLSDNAGRAHDPFNPEVSPINLRYNLVHQKLAMLNACILRRIRDQQRQAMEAIEDATLAARYHQFIHPSLFKATTASDARRSSMTSVSDDEPLATVSLDYQTLFPESQRRRLSAFLREDNALVAGHQQEALTTNLASTMGMDISPQGQGLSTYQQQVDSASDMDSTSSSSFGSCGSSELLGASAVFRSVPQAGTPRRTDSTTAIFSPAPLSESVSNLGRQGHLYPLNDLLLLATGEPLWVPEALDTPLMTEDMLLEQEQYLVGLGTSPEAAQRRAEILSAQLLSDMEAFKAANPGSVLGDFVRWHSPRDWVSDEQLSGTSAMGNEPRSASTSLSVTDDPGHLPSVAFPSVALGKVPDRSGTQTPREGANPPGQLSLRMAEQDNMWQQLWNVAKPVPAFKQQPLFDYHREASKVLDYLARLSADELFQQLLPGCFLLALDAIQSTPVVTKLPYLEAQAHQVAKTFKSVKWHLCSPQEPRHEELLTQLESLETHIGRAWSLLHRFPYQYDMVNRLLVEKET